MFKSILRLLIFFFRRRPREVAQLNDFKSQWKTTEVIECMKYMYNFIRKSSKHKIYLRPEFFIYLFNISSLSNFPKSEIKIKVKNSILFLFFPPCLIQSQLSK